MSKQDVTSSADEMQLRCRSILSSLLDPVVVIDAFGTIQDASEASHAVFGWEPQELVGANVSVLMPEPHRSAHDGFLARYLETGETNILGRPREFDAVHRDGSIVPVEISVSRVDVPGRDHPLFVGLIRDITSQRQAQAALEESEHRFRAMLEQVQLIAISLDTEGRVTFANRHMLRVAGWTREELIGRDWFTTFVCAADRERARRLLEECIRTGEIRPHFENEIVTRDGRRHLVAWNNTVVRDSSGKVVGATGIGVDITEQRRTEEALSRHGEELEALVAARTTALEISHKKLRQADRLATIGTLVAGLGHDMNNVLLPVRCHLDAFGAFDLPEGASEHLQAVRSSLGYLQQLTDGLRLLALDPSDPRASTGSTDLDSWWRQISPLITRAARSEIAVEVDLPPDLPSVPVSPHRLTQAVLNLVVNASEAIEAKGRIRIGACRAEAGRCVELSVSDDGRGMSQEVKRRALDPFYSTKPRGLGTGLGLALVDAMARSTGGSVRIDSEPAQGTTVVLSLPAIEVEVEPTEGPAGRSATITTSDQRLATLVSSLLRAAAFDVRIAEDGGPDGCSLWITDPTAARMHRARRFVSEQAGRVIVLGRPEKSWAAVGAIVVDEPDNFEELREKIGGVVSAIKG